MKLKLTGLQSTFLLSYHDENSHPLLQLLVEAPTLTRVFPCLVLEAVVLPDVEGGSTLVVADVVARRLVDMGQDQTSTDLHLVRRQDHRERLLPEVLVVDIVADRMRHTHLVPDQNRPGREEGVVVVVVEEEDLARLMTDDRLEAAVMMATEAEADLEVHVATGNAL